MLPKRRHFHLWKNKVSDKWPRGLGLVAIVLTVITYIWLYRFARVNLAAL